MWVVISYFKKNEEILISNLKNQCFEYYIPKINLYKNGELKVDNFFPGYAFIKCHKNTLIAPLNYTRGVNKVIKFGNNYGFISDKQIKEIKHKSEESLINPIHEKKPINSQVKAIAGPFKGIYGTLKSFSSKDRVEVLYTMMGRTISIEMIESSIR
jgi:transcription antitermination factor NusG